MSVKLTHLDKIFWPKERYTKGDVIAYYEKIAPYLLPHLKDRAESLNRFPDGIKGKHFYQKDVDPEQLPRFVKSVPLRAKSAGKTVHYVVCNNRDTLLYLANLGCIEINPWASRIQHPDKPDFMTLDLDPSASDDFDDVVAVAQTAHMGGTHDIHDEKGRSMGPADNDGEIAEGRDGHVRRSGRQDYTDAERVQDADMYVERRRAHVAEKEANTAYVYHWVDEHVANLTEDRFKKGTRYEKFDTFNEDSFRGAYVQGSPFDRESAGRPFQAN